MLNVGWRRVDGGQSVHVVLRRWSREVGLDRR